MFEIAHQPGALADAMNVFKRNRLNLTWIESFPIARPEGGYMFFVELEGHETDARVRKRFGCWSERPSAWKSWGRTPRWPQWNKPVRGASELRPVIPRRAAWFLPFKLPGPSRSLLGSGARVSDPRPLAPSVP